MDISRDTCYLLTCSIDGDVRLWSLQERACVVATVLVFPSSYIPSRGVLCGVFASVTETPGLSVAVWTLACMCVQRAKRRRGEWSRIIVAV